MKKYTVVLILPDYAATDYGSDFWIFFALAKSPAHAVAKARAGLDEDLKKEDGDDVCLNEPEDAAIVAVFLNLGGVAFLHHRFTACGTRNSTRQLRVVQLIVDPCQDR